MRIATIQRCIFFIFLFLFQSNSFFSHTWFTFRSSAVMNINLLVKATSLKLFVLFILPLWLSHSYSGHYLWLHIKQKKLVSLITLTLLLAFVFAYCHSFNLQFAGYSLKLLGLSVLWPTRPVILSNGLHAILMQNNKIQYA